MPTDRLILDDFLPYRLSYTTNLVSDTIARAYDALFGLTIPEWRVVAVVAESSGVTQAAIGQKTRMDKVTVSRAAIALVDRGLLVREKHPEDRRAHQLALSETGRELYRAVAPKALELERMIFAQIDAEELKRFMATLRRIDALAEEVAAAI